MTHDFWSWIAVSAGVPRPFRGASSPKSRGQLADDFGMATIGAFPAFLILVGGFVVVYVTLKAIGQCAAVLASMEIAERRDEESRRHAEDAAAEAAGRAAALEPLALNADGSVEEPILAMAEERR